MRVKLYESSFATHLPVDARTRLTNINPQWRISAIVADINHRRWQWIFQYQLLLDVDIQLGLNRILFKSRLMRYFWPSPSAV